jgi:hypothetical protein
MSGFGFGNEPIIPEPDWGNPSPNIDPDEWVEEEEDDEE